MCVRMVYSVLGWFTLRLGGVLFVYRVLCCMVG